MVNCTQEISWAYRSIISKKMFDFILDNKSLETSAASGKPAIEWQIHNNETAREKYKYQSSKDKYSFDDKRLLKHSEKERIFRLIYSNYCLLNIFTFTRDAKLERYLNKNVEREWQSVGLKQLRDNCGHRNNALSHMQLKRSLEEWVDDEDCP